VLAGDDGVLPLIEMLAASEYFDAGKAIPEIAGHALALQDVLAAGETFSRRGMGGTLPTCYLGQFRGVWRPLPCVAEGRAPLTKETSRR
jgi:hypothetical protein